MGAAQAARTRAVPLCRFATFPPPRGGIFPKPLPALPFLVGRKGSKRPFKGAPAPLKIPRWGALWPRPPKPPRPDSLVVTAIVLRAKRCAPLQKMPASYKAFSRIQQLPGRLICLFRARDVRAPRSVTCPNFALTGQSDRTAWACGPMLSRSGGIVHRTFIRIFTEADLWKTRTEHSAL